MKKVVVKMDFTLTFNDGVPHSRRLIFGGKVKDFYKNVKEMCDEIIKHYVQEDIRN